MVLASLNGHEGVHAVEDRCGKTSQMGRHWCWLARGARGSSRFGSGVSRYGPAVVVLGGLP